MNKGSSRCAIVSDFDALFGVPHLVKCGPALIRMLLSEIEPLIHWNASQKQRLMVIALRRLLHKLGDIAEGCRLGEACQRVSEAIGVLEGELKVARPLLGIGLLNLLDIRAEVEGGHCASKTRAKEC